MVSSGFFCCDDGDKNGMIPGCPRGSLCAMIVESIWNLTSHRKTITRIAIRPYKLICNIIHDQGGVNHLMSSQNS